jgi:arginase
VPVNPVRVRLIGAPTDINSSFLRGPALAPTQIRQVLFSDVGNPAAENGRELGREIQLEDFGDLALIEGPGDDEQIESAVISALTDGCTPIVIGGDHSITFPILKAIAAHHGPVSILHIDAHPDLYDELLGNRRSHASPFARIMENRLATRLVQVGIRTLNTHQRDQADRFGVEIVPMRDFAPPDVPQLAGKIYVSIDLDGLDPSSAPGVSHHEPGGLTVRQLLDVLAPLQGQVIGADVVELNPSRDVHDMTAAVAAKLVRELASLM